ncbi:MAG TPA: hypothetical protein VGM87_08930, partial [Roseomonas sp.]
MTGRLGPIGQGMSFADLAECLGPPIAIECCADGAGWTWSYGQLAVHGPMDGRAAVTSIRLGEAGLLAGPLAMIGAPHAETYRKPPDRCMVLGLDFDGSVRPGALFERLRQAGARGEIGYRDDRDLDPAFVIILRYGPVTLRFRGDYEVSGSGMPPPSLNLASSIIGACFDHCAQLEAIEWCPQHAEAVPRWLDADAYLRGAASTPPGSHPWRDGRNMLHPPVPLLAFLATGQLGPIDYTASRRDIGKLLGPPKSFGRYGDHWSYGALQLSFDEEDGRLRWLQ